MKNLLLLFATLAFSLQAYSQSCDVTGLSNVSTTQSSTITFTGTCEDACYWTSSSNVYYVTTSTNYAAIQAYNWVQDGATGWIEVVMCEGPPIYKSFTISNPNSSSNIPDENDISFSVQYNITLPGYGSGWTRVSAYYYGSEPVTYWEWNSPNSYVPDPNGSENIIYLPPYSSSGTITIQSKACNNDGCSSYASVNVNT